MTAYTFTDPAVRLCFLQTLSTLPEAARCHLLRVEEEAELAALWELAMREELTDVAATIEVHANSRGFN